MQDIITISNAEIRSAINKEYSKVAKQPEQGFHFISGRPLTKLLGYNPHLLNKIPEGAIESFAGVGNPFKMGCPVVGETVLDIGCGAGIDSLIASKMVDLEGLVIGIDITPEMISKAKANAWDAFALNTRFINAYAEAIPLPDDMVDLAISNGVINLCPDKEAVFKEIYRVLKSGGRIQIADVLLDNPVPESSKDRAHLWTTCVAGGLLHYEYINIMRNSGFKNIQIEESFDVFKDAPVASSALKFGAKGYNIYAEK